MGTVGSAGVGFSIAGSSSTPFGNDTEVVELFGRLVLVEVHTSLAEAGSTYEVIGGEVLQGHVTVLVNTTLGTGRDKEGETTSTIFWASSPLGVLRS